MLAVAWPFGFPARFADSGGAQTRYAQTVRTFSPVSAALLGHTTRPGETAETMIPFIMADQLAVLRQGPPIDKSVRPCWQGGRRRPRGGLENVSSGNAPWIKRPWNSF